MQPLSVLAMTATAGPRVVRDICRTLNISADEGDSSLGDSSRGVKLMKIDRDNIDVSCFFLSSHDERLSTVSYLV